MNTQFIEEDTKDMLQKKLFILKQNHENISAEELKSRYKKAYEKLLSEINTLAGQLIDEIVFHFLVEEPFKNEGQAMVLSLFKQNAKKVTIALYKNYSAEEFQNICQDIYEEVLAEYFKKRMPEWGNVYVKYTLNPWKETKITIKAS